ncbi:IPTL-CTERM sorting domain-containing protein [Halioglobus japonicus]
MSAADPRPVPALGLWQLAVLALLIAGLGGGLQRRR